jgi:hypothetical protein
MRHLAGMSDTILFSGNGTTQGIATTLLDLGESSTVPAMRVI